MGTSGCSPLSLLTHVYLQPLQGRGGASAAAAVVCALWGDGSGRQRCCDTGRPPHPARGPSADVAHLDGQHPVRQAPQCREGDRVRGRAGHSLAPRPPRLDTFSSPCHLQGLVYLPAAVVGPSHPSLLHHCQRPRRAPRGGENQARAGDWHIWGGGGLSVHWMLVGGQAEAPPWILIPPGHGRTLTGGTG